MPGTVPSVKAVQQFCKNAKRPAKKAKTPFDTRADLLNYIQERLLPTNIDDLKDQVLYTPDVSATWDKYSWFAIPFLCKKNVLWIQQVLESDYCFSLHGDSKHKLHIGRWVLTTFGIHHVPYDTHHRKYSHQFLPLIYLFTKQNESTDVVRFAMDTLQGVAIMYFGQRLEFGPTVSDMSDGLRTGAQCH